MNSSNQNHQNFLSQNESKCFFEIANCIIPPTSQFPGAGEIDIFNLKDCEVELSTDNKANSIKLLEETEKLSIKMFDSNFMDLTMKNKITILKILEDNQRNLFKSIIHFIYSQYYSDPTVIRLKNLPNKPFQPEGFKLESFDQTSVKNVIARGKKYID